MRLWRAARRSLRWKLFFTYLLIVAVGAVVLATAAEAFMPLAFERHLLAMMAEMGQAEALGADLYANFRRALLESGLIAAALASVTAIGLSLYVSRRVVARIEEMRAITRDMAAGHYRQRIALADPGRPLEELDQLERLAVSFNRLAALLDQTETRRRELIGNVAHELRTPLTAIKAYMEGLLDGVLPSDAGTYSRVYDEADRLQRLVDDLQELSRLEEHAVVLDLQPLNVAELVAGVVERLAPQFEAKGLALTREIPPDLPRVLGDRDRLTQVLVNLLGNALQYTPPGGHVRIVARPEDGLVQIAVRDDGIGIAPEHLPHLFERFYRVDRSRARVGGGSGIGLTIAQHLVEAHGGQISAASAGLGQGSTFRFTVPMARPSAPR
ncbi:MAG: two-component sensor histidine kinase [Anaerolineae bacterium]|nr:two-component sensor histidine kinase [Anaerolineae bacterium]